MRPGESKNTAIELYTNNVIHSYSQVGIKCQCPLQKKLIFLMQNFYNLTIYNILIFLVQSLYMIYKKTDVSYAKFVYNHIQNVHTKYHNFFAKDTGI